MKRLFLLPLFLLAKSLMAQCPPQQVEVMVEIMTDNFGYETTWQLGYANGGTIASGGSSPAYENNSYHSYTYCVSADACLRFQIWDSFGDGICCSYGEGYYRVSIDGEEVATGGNFGTGTQAFFNCGPGLACSSAIEVGLGSYTAPENNTWYEFTPAEHGTYGILACDNSCDTRIWVYDYCQGLIPADDNTATVYYDNNQGGCGPQAMIGAALLEAGVTYWIRIGSNNNTCTGSINWELVYNGPIEGCMNPSACNYNPLATVSSGECFFPGDPECPDGPDLTLNEEMLASSMYLSSLVASNNDCRVEEGCLSGYGLRNVLRFSTHILNIGNTDYYIGSPQANPDQFNFENCHNHIHYDSYAEYRLFDVNSVEVPIGFKNGFCVMDLECWSGGGTAQYGCSTMGISKGCGDIYSASLDCQFIDITDVDTGLYTFVNTTNWQQRPDALGRHELSYANNWAQVCIYIGRTPEGQLYVDQRDECEPYTDCAGVIYGNTQPDCTGECGGSVLRGDLNTDGVHNVVDAQMYVAAIIADDTEATPCKDLNADGEIDVYDAALLTDCAMTIDMHVTGSAHDHCVFPYGLTNIFDTVKLSIGAIDFENQTIDIHILNPTAKVVAYQFDMSGVSIGSVTNLIDPQQYPITPSAAVGGGRVIGISYQDSLIERSNVAVPLCRINYLSINAPEVCISHVQSIVNGAYEEVIPRVVDGCVAANVSVDELENGGIVMEVFPNPFSERATLRVTNRFSTPLQVHVMDITGKHISDLGTMTDGRMEISRSGMAPGVYIVQATDGRRVLARQRMVVQ
jgi:hypothetical protein